MLNDAKKDGVLNCNVLRNMLLNMFITFLAKYEVFETCYGIKCRLKNLLSACVKLCCIYTGYNYLLWMHRLDK